jgi:hypothetical protein
MTRGLRAAGVGELWGSGTDESAAKDKAPAGAEEGTK